MTLWEVWNLSQTYQKLPSEILHVQDEIAAYCLDRAVRFFANHVQRAIDAATEGKSGAAAQVAAENALAPWIGTEQKFRDPMPGHF